MNRPTHTVQFWRDPEDRRFWLAQLLDTPGCHTFGRTLAQAQERVNEAIAVWFDIDEDTFDVAYEVRDLPGGLLDEIAETLRLRDQAGELERKAVRATRNAAQRLVNDAGLSTRDAAQVLGLSHQRVAQLVRDERVAAPQAS